MAKLSVTAPIKDVDVTNNFLDNSLHDLQAARERWRGVNISSEDRKTLLLTNAVSDVSYSPNCSHSYSMSPNHSHQSNNAESVAWNTIFGSLLMHNPLSIRNPNKAVITIDAITSEILVANSLACELFGFSQHDFVGKLLSDFIKMKTLVPLPAIQESHLQNSGTVVEIAGKVVDALDSSGNVIPVSVWVHKLANEEKRCLVALEPVERTTAKVIFDCTGSILECDEQFAVLFGYSSASELKTSQMTILMPSLQIPKTCSNLSKAVRKQMVTGKTKNGISFPLSVRLRSLDHLVNETTTDLMAYKATVWVFMNISGLVTVTADGFIQTINEHFALLLFGQSKLNLLGKEITVLLPNFYDTCELQEYDAEHSTHELGQISNSGVTNNVEPQTGFSPTKNKRIIGKKIHVDNGLFPPAMHSTPHYCIKPGNARKKQFNVHNYESKITANNDEQLYSPKRYEDVHEKMTLTNVLCGEFSETADEYCNTTNSVYKKSKTSLRHENSNDNCAIGDLGSNFTSDQDQEKSISVQVIASDGTLSDVDGSNLKLIKSNSTNISYFSVHDNVNHHDNLCNSLITDAKLRATDCQISNLSVDGVTQKPCITSFTSFSSVTVPNELIVLDETHEIIEDNSNDAAETMESYIVLDQASISKYSLSSNDGSCSDNEELVLVDEINESNKSVSAVSFAVSSPQVHCNGRASEIKIINEHQLCKPQLVDNDIGNHNEVACSSCVNCPEINISPLSNITNVAVKQLFSNNEARCEGLVKSDCDDDFVLQMNRLNVMESEKEDCCDARESGDFVERSHKVDKHSKISEGSFCGIGMHRDGTLIELLYEVHQVCLSDNQPLYCLWIYRLKANNSSYGLPNSISTTTLASYNSYAVDEICSMLNSASVLDASQADTMSPDKPEVPLSPSGGCVALSPCGDNMDVISSEYTQCYETLQTIGKGAFGSVRFAVRRENGEEVVVKFIRKVKVRNDCWMDDERYGHIPMEIFLLVRLDHPNIVRVLDVYEDEMFFEMVMEKHGSGMDLFEFIERQPKLDEPLASYIFRQLVSAIAYLHDLNVVHRDIKDENVIIDENFNIRLIDFGSAAFREPGKFFGVFCGTMEFCSPEVLLGNQYEGPELEIWTLGVTLYTLVFAENPFANPEEAIKAVFTPPFAVSDELIDLVSWMLEPSPGERAHIEDVQAHVWTNLPVDVESYSWANIVGCADFTGNMTSASRSSSLNESSAS